MRRILRPVLVFLTVTAAAIGVLACVGCHQPSPGQSTRDQSGTADPSGTDESKQDGTGLSITAPLGIEITVNDNGVGVKAPGVNVRSDQAGVNVKAPGVDIRSNEDGVNVKAPGVSVRSDSHGVDVQAPLGVRVRTGSEPAPAPTTPPTP